MFPHLPRLVFPPSLLEPYRRWHHKLSPVCSREISSGPGTLKEEFRHRTCGRTGVTNRKVWAYLSELVKRGIGGVMGDEEPHAIVGNLYCSGAVHVGETA